MIVSGCGYCIRVSFRHHDVVCDLSTLVEAVKESGVTPAIACQFESPVL